jgi:hypothetical protein
VELKRILAFLMGLALIVLSVAPYIKAGELSVIAPKGWQLVGSKRMKVPTKDLQEIYTPDGTPTGRYGRPIDHAWFGEGKLIDIGGYRVWVLDTYQDTTGCHVKVKIEDREGVLTLAGGQSQGVEWNNLRLYITWAKTPPEEGDWRTSDGKCFYGFEEFELTLYRVPTATEIPLSVVGTVLGAGFVILGVLVIGGGDRRGVLPVLVGSAFLCALIIRLPGYEEKQPVAAYAKFDWLGAWAMASDDSFSRFAVLDNSGVRFYDNNGKLLWRFQIPISSYGWIGMSGDGRLIIFGADGAFVLLENRGTSPLSKPYWRTFWLSRNGNRIAYAECENVCAVIDTSGNLIRRWDFSEEWGDIRDLRLNDNGTRIMIFVENWDANIGKIMVFDVDSGSLLLEKSGTPFMRGFLSRTGRYVYISGTLYDVDTQSTIWKGREPWQANGYIRATLEFAQDDKYFSDGYTIVSLPDAQVIYSHSTPLPAGSNYAIKPSGDGIVYYCSDGTLRSFGNPTWGSIPAPVASGVEQFGCVICNDEYIYFTVPNWGKFVGEVFVTKFRYSLDIRAALPVISVDSAEPASSYSAFENPAQRRVVDLVPCENYVFVDALGNFTEIDNVKLAENRLEIYMDNDKRIDICLLGRPAILSISPSIPRPSENVKLSWSLADYYVGEVKASPPSCYYELQLDNEGGFPHPITYTAIEDTTFIVEPPENQWKRGTYWIRVRAVVVTRDNRVVSGCWSDPTYFELKTPSPSWLRVVPSNPMYDQSVMLDWEPVTLADYYQLRLKSPDGTERMVESHLTQTTYQLSPPANGWISAKPYVVGVRAVNNVYGESAWTENSFAAGPVVGLLAGPPVAPKPPLQLAVTIPVVPHFLVSVFSSLGQVAGFYTLSLLMVLSGLGLIAISLKGYRW